jgi:hypothetical protein
MYCRYYIISNLIDRALVQFCVKLFKNNTTMYQFEINLLCFVLILYAYHDIYLTCEKLFSIGNSSF